MSFIVPEARSKADAIVAVVGTINVTFVLDEGAARRILEVLEGL